MCVCRWIFDFWQGKMHLVAYSLQSWFRLGQTKFSATMRRVATALVGGSLRLGHRVCEGIVVSVDDQVASLDVAL